MGYENRDIPEGINVSKAHPLKEFAWLAAGLIILVVFSVLVLSLMAEHLTRYIPFSLEQKATASVSKRYADEHPLNQQQQEVQTYLQTLADTLVVNQGLDDDMSITVHYVDDDTVNAFATLGGHVIIFKGLLQKMPHENALSMVMAHEIAHIKHRDPIISLGRGLTVYLALSSIVGIGNNSTFEQVLGQTGLLTMMSFSREQESAADRTALLTLKRYYGHLKGAATLFKLLQKEEAEHSAPSFFNSHPLTKDRIKAVMGFAKSIKAPADSTVKAFPDNIHKALRPPAETLEKAENQ
ncbi:MAG: M48 family metallopeptidase [Methylococcales bacterium]